MLIRRRPVGTTLLARQVCQSDGFPGPHRTGRFYRNGLPVGISFLGRAFDEPRLLALGYAFEQLSKARRLPVNTPPLE